MSRVTQFVATILLIAGSAPVRGETPRTSPESLRSTIQKLWSNNGDEAAQAVTTLEANPLALPVLRRAMAVDPNISHQGVLERLIAKAVSARDKVNGERVERWAKDGRLDLLTEVRALTNGGAADAAFGHLIDAGQVLRRSGTEALGDRLARKPGGFLVRLPGPSRAAFDQSKGTPAFDAVLAYPEKDTRSHLALFADRIDLPTEDLQRSILVARSALDLLPKSRKCEVADSLVFSNTPFPFGVVSQSVVVVDGDVELIRPTRIAGSVVVVNGDLTRDSDSPPPSFDTSVFWVTGRVNVPPPTRPANVMVFAGGKVADAEKLAAKGCVEQNVKEPPLPVRFFDPAEFGLTLEVTKAGLKVAKVGGTNAFADAGLKAGDVITRVGEVDTATALAFRRELRRGVVEGAVLLDVTRGKDRLELLVAVPDLPVAPKKDNDLKATPPEKK